MCISTVVYILLKRCPCRSWWKRKTYWCQFSAHLNSALKNKTCKKCPLYLRLPYSTSWVELPDTGRVITHLLQAIPQNEGLFESPILKSWLESELTPVQFCLVTAGGDSNSWKPGLSQLLCFQSQERRSWTLALGDNATWWLNEVSSSFTLTL